MSRVSFDLIVGSQADADALLTAVSSLVATKAPTVIVTTGQTQALGPESPYHVYGAVDVADGLGLKSGLLTLWSSGQWVSRVLALSKVFLNFAATVK